MTTPTDERYFERVEEHFGRRRGGPLVLSPKDWQLIQKWQNQGIPLPVVLRGINHAFDRFAASSPGPDRINSLLYCAQEVERAWQDDRAARARRAGATIDDAAGLPSAGHLRTVAARCVHAAETHRIAPLRDKLRDTARQLETLADAADNDGLDARTLDARATALQEDLQTALDAAPVKAVDLAALGIPSFSPYDV